MFNSVIKLDISTNKHFKMFPDRYACKFVSNTLFEREVCIAFGESNTDIFIFSYVSCSLKNEKHGPEFMSVTFPGVAWMGIYLMDIISCSFGKPICVCKK